MSNEVGDAWPVVGGDDWPATWETVQLWTQVVGKVRMALEPAVNHWWHVPLYVSVRGLSTGLVHTSTGGLEMELDVGREVLALRTTRRGDRTVPFEGQTVASFHDATMAALSELDVDVAILPWPVELPNVIPFAEDTQHGTYEGDSMRRFHGALLQADRLLRTFRARFGGKASPVHFFWGAFDLATTRFSGRDAPLHPGGVPNCPDWVMHEAYSHELHSCGFWPGGSDEGSFYAYAYPEPASFAEWTVPEGASYDAALGEFLLPYRAVREADDPDALVLAFLQATYDATAELGAWDRASLER